MMAAALLESLAFTGFLVLLSVILPPTWLKDGFAMKGFIFVGVFTATSILLQRTLKDSFPPPAVLILSFILPLILVAFLIFLTRASPTLQNILLNIEDRILVMLFVYVPIGVISILFVLFQTVL